MFSEVAKIGALSTQLLYYRGPAGLGGECRASRWVNNPMEFASLMGKITCQAGHTQIGKVLYSTPDMNRALRKVNALLFVGDAFEETPDTIVQKAAETRKAHHPGVHVPGGIRNFDSPKRASRTSRG